MDTSNRVPVLGIPIDALDRDDILQRVTFMMLTGRPHQVITINSLMVLEAQNNPKLQEACDAASLIVADSSGVTWAARLLGRKKVERYAGIDMAFDLCGVAARLSLPVYFLGGASGVAEQAAKSLSRVYPELQVSGMRDGFFKPEDEPAIIRDIAQSQARVVLVGLGMPKQELWIHHQLPHLPPAVYIGVGGSFDVWGGRSQRAPMWARQVGIEWLYRLKREPFRWKRIAQLPKFALKIASERFS